MTPATIYAQVQKKAFVDTNQYLQADFLADINMAKDEFWSAIVSRLEEDYNWEKWTTDSVALQSEYTIPTVAYNTAWAKVLKWVSVNYNNENYTNTWAKIYLKARLVNPQSLEFDWDYYVENQSNEDPIYYVADNSFFIAPAPQTAVTNWIKLTWIRKIPDYTITTTESEMKIPVDFQQVLVYATIPQALMNKWEDENTIQTRLNRYEQKKKEAIQNMSMRVEWPVTMTYPTYTNTDEIILNVN